jgi:single-strand DNA-binding protein
MGNLGQDPELRYTQSQQPVTTLNVATTERRDEKEYTEWHSVVVWGKQAENCCKYLKKGRQVLVEGRIQTRSWDDNGEKKYRTEIVAQNVQFVGGATGNRKPEPVEATNAMGADDVPF